jgi:type I restriction enzyme R subunit
MRSEADTCRRFVVPRLQAAGWDNEPHRLNEQVKFADGRIIVTGRHVRRRPGERTEDLLRHRLDILLSSAATPPGTPPVEAILGAARIAQLLCSLPELDDG